MMHHTGIVDALNFEIQEQSSHCEKHDKSKLTSRNHFYLALENNPYSLCLSLYYDPNACIYPHTASWRLSAHGYM